MNDDLRIVVVASMEEAEAERRFLYGGFRDRDMRALFGLRARQQAAAQVNIENGLMP